MVRPPGRFGAPLTLTRSLLDVSRRVGACRWLRSLGDIKCFASGRHVAKLADGHVTDGAARPPRSSVALVAIGPALLGGRACLLCAVGLRHARDVQGLARRTARRERRGDGEPLAKPGCGAVPSRGGLDRQALREGRVLLWSRAVPRAAQGIASGVCHRTTTFQDYLFSVECRFQLGDGTHRTFEATGFIESAADQSFELWPKSVRPEWHEEWVAASVRKQKLHLKIYVTRVQTLQCILLYEADVYPGDGNWMPVPYSSAMRLSEDWTPLHTARIYSKVEEEVEASSDLGRLIVLDFDWGTVEDAADVDAIWEWSYEFSMSERQVLRYLEHFAPFHM
jgi:hypothetical protein